MAKTLRSVGKLSLCLSLFAAACKPAAPPPRIPCEGEVERRADGTCPDPTPPDAGAPECLATCSTGKVCQDNACVQEACAGVRCGADEACADGTCYPKNCPTEVCANGSVCANGLCALPSCIGVTCANAGEVCADGQCLSPVCGSGNRCAPGLVCDSEYCVSPQCVGVGCSADAVCVEGVCVSRACNGALCDPGFACDPVLNQCVFANCLGVSCPSGQACDNGTCVGGGTDGGPADAGLPTKLGFTTSPQSIPVGACSGVTTVQTQTSGGVGANVPATTTLTLSAPASMSFYAQANCTGQATTSLSIPSGSKTANFYFKGADAGAYTISVTSTPVLSPASQTETITALPATKLAFTVQPSNINAGAALPNIQVTVQDVNGATVTGSTSSITLAIGTNPASGVLSGTKVVSASNGIATFSGLSIDKFGNGYTLKATSPGLADGMSASFNVLPVAAKLAFTTQPTNVNAGASISPAVQVTVQDASGATVTGSTASVTLAIGTNPASGVLSGTKVVSAVSGIATFSGLSIDKFGNGYTLKATSSGLADGTSASFSVLQVATKLAFTVQPTNVDAATSISPAVQVTVQDANSVTVAGSTASVTLAIGTNPGGGILSGTVVVSASGGVATFSNLSINNAGNGYTLAASSGSLSGATSSTFNVNSVGGGATRLAFTVQPSNTAAGASISPAVKVAIQDNLGNTVTSSTASVTLAIGTNPASGTLSGTKVVAAVSGVATFSNLSINNVGNGYTLAASSAPLTGTTSNAFNISSSVGPPAKVAFVVLPTTTNQGAVISPAVQVAVQDSNGVTVTSSSASITVAIGTNPGAGLLSGTKVVAAVSGVASFSNLAIDNAGTGYTLTASSGVLTQATSNAFNIVAVAPTKLAFTSSPQTVNNGLCSSGATLQTQDSQGTARNVSAGTTVILSSTSPTMTFYIDSVCSAFFQTSSLYIQAGQNSAFFYFKDTTNGTPTITAAEQFAQLTSAQQGATIQTPPPAKFGFGNSPSPVAAGRCTWNQFMGPFPLSVQLLDGSNNPTTTATDTTVTLTSNSGTLKFYSDSSCLTQTTTATIVAGTNSALVYFKDTAVGTPTVTADDGAGPLAPGSQQETVEPKLEFITTPQSVNAGVCSAPATVQTQDGLGTPYAVPSNKLIYPWAASITLYSDSGCTNALTYGTSLTILSSTSTVSVYFKSATPASTSVWMYYGSMISSNTVSQTANVQAGPPVTLVFLSAAQNVVQDACSGLVTVVSKDSLSNNSAVSSNTPLNLTTDTGTMQFFTDSACATTAVTSVTLASGTYSTSFYFKDPGAGTPSLTVDDGPGGLTAATQVETIATAVPVKLVFSTPAQNVGAGTCSDPVNVQSRNSGNNPSNVTVDTTVSLTSAPASLTFYSDAVCSSLISSVLIPAGQNTKTVYFKDSSQGSRTLTADDGPGGLAAGTQAATISDPNPIGLFFISPNLYPKGGVCSDAGIVQSKNDAGAKASVASNLEVLLRTDAGVFDFYGDSQCAAGTITSTYLAANQNTVAFYIRNVMTPPVIEDTLHAIPDGGNLLEAKQYAAIDVSCGGSIAPGRSAFDRRLGSGALCLLSWALFLFVGRRRTRTSFQR